MEANWAALPRGYDGPETTTVGTWLSSYIGRLAFDDLMRTTLLQAFAIAAENTTRNYLFHSHLVAVPTSQVHNPSRWFAECPRIRDALTTRSLLVAFCKPESASTANSQQLQLPTCSKVRTMVGRPAVLTCGVSELYKDCVLLLRLPQRQTTPSGHSSGRQILLNRSHAKRPCC
jgi:hypothetical protein